MFLNNKRYFSFLSGVALSLALYVASVPTLAAAQSAEAGYAMTPGRLVASSAALVGLIGAAAGIVAMVRGSAAGRFAVGIAIGCGSIAAIVGGFRAATATGIGTGGGLAGAIVAVVLGITAIILGWLALVRARRTA